MNQEDDQDLTPPQSGLPPAATQSLVLREFEVTAHIGATAAERAKPQSLRLAITVELRPATPTSDRLEETVDYGALTRDLRALIQTSRFRLLETLAAHLATRCLQDERALACTIGIEKLRRYDDVNGLGVVLTFRRP